MNEKKNSGESVALCAVKIVYRFATLTCHRCCYYVGEKCSLRSRVTGVDIMAKKWKNIAKGSFYQKMYKNIICSFLNYKHFIFPEFSCILQHYKMAAVAATILGPAAKRYGRF
ncbi:hypothetical protein WDU94_008326 [Cyamophila willieti]